MPANPYFTPSSVAFVPGTYIQDPQNNIASLILAQGQHRADAQRQQGEITGRLYENLGNQISNLFQQYAKARTDEPYRQAQMADLQAQADERKRATGAATTATQTNQTIDGLMKSALTTDPDTGATIYDRNKLQTGFVQAGIGHLWPQYSELVDKSDTSLKTLKDAHKAAIGDVARIVDASGNDATVFQNELLRGVHNGLFTQQEAAPYLEAAQRDPSTIGKLTATILGKKPDEGAFTLGEGQQRFDAQGKPIASGPPKPAPNAPNPTEASLAMAAQSPDPAVSGPAKAALGTLRAQRPPTGNELPPAVATNPGISGEDFLKTLPPTQAGLVKALAEGRLQFPSGFALKSPYWQGLLQSVGQYDPSFDAVNYGGRSKARQDFTAGASAKQITALNTVIGHLGDLSQKSEALNGGSIQAVNAAKNWLKTATGSPDVTNFNTVKKGVTDELTRVWRQAGGSEQDIKTWAETLNAAESPAQLKGAFSTISGMLGARLDALENQKQQGLGRFGNDISVITPKAQTTLQRLSDETAAPATAAPRVGSTVTLKNGQRVVIKKLNPDGTFEY